MAGVVISLFNISDSKHGLQFEAADLMLNFCNEPFYLFFKLNSLLYYLLHFVCISVDILDKIVFRMCNPAVPQTYLQHSMIHVVY